MRAGALQTAAILAGGAAGTLARAGVNELLPHDPGAWPWATLVVNLAGTFILAAATAWLAKVARPAAYWQPLLGVGFCGALTTFSAFQIETIRLAQHGAPELALAYAALSLTLGLACAVAGALIPGRIQA